MTDLAEIVDRLDRLESREALRALASVYAIACDEHDMPRLMSLFTEDAAFDAPNGAMVANGRDAIEAMFIETFKIRGPSYHWTHDVSITIDPDDADRATGLVLSHAETCPNGVVSIAAMRYEDTYRRENGQWLFARRIIKFLYYVPAAEFSNGLNAERRVHMGGDVLPADLPETLAPWQAFIHQHGPLQI